MSASENQDSGRDARTGETLLKILETATRRQEKAEVSRSSVLVHLFRMASSNSIGLFVILLVLSALSGTGVLFLLNAEGKNAENASYSPLSAVLFVALLVLYRFAQNRLIRGSALAIETSLDKKRQRVVSDVLNQSLRDVELIEPSRLRDGISSHYGSLSQTIVPIIAGAEAIVLVIFMFGYLVSLSVLAGALTLTVVAVTILGYINQSKSMAQEMAKASQADAQFRSLTDAIVLGSKELQLSMDRREALKAAMKQCSEALAKGRSASAAQFADLIATGTTVSYLLAGAVVFVMPLVVGLNSGGLSQVVIAIIFLLGPIGSVVHTAQQVSTAQFALREINAFERQVSRKQADSTEVMRSDSALAGTIGDGFESLHFDSVRYEHGGSDGFAISNINFTLKKGEIVFLTGGNGSGKTTLLRVLTGLYPRTSGSVRLDKHELSPLPPQAYREFFSGVFADFHLFDRPFGLNETGIKDFSRWLTRLDVRDKFTDDLSAIPTAALSTGQRKRVALALALAENRPVLVLDEWAADQDPETRRRFYTEILPDLRSKGRTIFAITHDEQYFHLCDHRLHMSEGRLVTGDSK